MKKMYIAGKTYIRIKEYELHNAYKSKEAFEKFIDKIQLYANGSLFKLVLERGNDEKK